jgi:hypothetical protein
MNQILPTSNALASIHVFWIVVWFVIVLALLAALVFLSVSRWGRSQPVRICVILSLLGHVLLAGYAATINIVAARAAAEQQIEVSFYDGAIDTFAAPEQPEEKPWERLPSAPPEPPKQPELETESQLASALNDVVPIPNLPDRAAPPIQATDDARQPRSDFADAQSQPPEQITTPDAQRQETATPDFSVVETSTPLSADEAREPDLPNPSVAQTDQVTSNLLPPRSADLESSDNQTDSQMRPVDAQALDPPNASSSADTGAAASRSPLSITGAAPSTPLTTMNDAGSHPAIRAPDHNAELPSVYRLRVAPEREKLAGRLGGSPQAEEAVELGLRWLASAQNVDGRWQASRWGAGRAAPAGGQNRQQAGAGADTGLTGLALLAFLAAGHTHVREGAYQDTVTRGLQFLLNQQSRNGNLSGGAQLFSAMYCHGMATFALSEAYAMTGDDRLRPAVGRAVNYILAAQHPTTGGWRYRPGDPGDTSQLGWQLMALKSAELAGIEFPTRSKQLVREFLKTVSSGRYGGLAAYRPGQQVSRAMTAEALACRQFLGLSPNSLAAVEAADYAVSELPGSERGRSEAMNFYFYYYATLALYQRQDDRWDRWNAALQSTLIGSQERLGSLAGSWHPNTVWGAYGGRVYTTAMATLCLEVYYRFLPLFADLEP